jgi:chromosome segregation and condensation protein ScpB
MNLQAEKIQIAKILLDTNSEALLKQVKAILSIYKTDLWDELSDYQKSCVKEAQTELEKGKGKSSHLVMAKYKKWLTK